MNDNKRNINKNNRNGMPDFFGGDGGQNGKNGDKRKFSWSFIYIAIALVLIGVYFFSSGDTSREVNDMEFYQWSRTKK